MKLAPIILFAYKRPDELVKVLTSLKANALAAYSELYIFVDGSKREEDIVKVEEVRRLCDEITGFKLVHRFYHDTNQGCANSIIAGITEVLKKNESAIIIEDDIVTSNNFLDFINQSILFYKSDKKVFSISGYCLPIIPPKDYKFDAFLFNRSGSWGWATWADRWFSVDWEVSDYEIFKKDINARREFKLGGSDLPKMLDDYMSGKIDAWDIRFTYSQFKQKGLTIYPTVSKVENIGFYGTDATHTQVYNRYKVDVDVSNKTTFTFPKETTLNKILVKQFQKHYSLSTRIGSKIMTILGFR